MDEPSADPAATYCAPARVTPTGGDGGPGASGPPYADCVYCGKPTEYAAATPGVTLCPVCEWQEAQRGACSG